MPAQFRSGRLDIGCHVNKWILRDHNKRVEFAKREVERQALRYIVRNLTLAPRVRFAAQQRLARMPCYAFPTQIKNRCIASGKGRGVLSDFRLCRIQFRLHALAGHIPGVKRASW